MPRVICNVNLFLRGICVLGILPKNISVNYIIISHKCRRNISLLKIAEQQLQEDVRDKKSAADVDMSIVRLRRRKANHKWVLEGSKYM